MHHENLLIFLDHARTQSLWYWVKRDGAKAHPRDHLYVKGQPGDLFLSKLATMVVDISELDAEGNIAITEVAGRLKKALDIERVTKKFYTEFQEQHLVFLELIEGIDNEQERRWYASVLLNRLMFIWFLQKKFFLDDGNENYLSDKLAESRKHGRDRYYSEFLHALFFEGFAKPEEKRTPSANKLLGKIKYLNGGLFLEHPVEQRWKKITIPDKAFDNLFALFKRYSWSLNDTPGGKDDEISPDVLGYIFEKYINQKAFGAYYTRPEITEYLCERTIHRLVLDGVNTKGIAGLVSARQFENIGELLIRLDASLCKKLLHDILPKLRLLDPACGSAAFLVAAMKTLINLYAAVIGKIKFLNDRALSDWIKKIEKEHPNINYFIKKRIITDNLFGVDIMKEAVEIAKLRLFLALVAAAEKVDDLEPLPNIDFNILDGNSLIGLMHVDESAFDSQTGVGSQERMTLRHEPGEGYLKMTVESKVAPDKKETIGAYLATRRQQRYREVLAEKNRLIETYRHAATYADDLTSLRDKIEKQKKEATGALDAILLAEFTHLGINARCPL